MITFKAIIIPNNRRKDGTYPVKIRVTFRGVSRRLATTLVCTPADLTRSLHIKSADILSRSNELIRKMRDAIKDVSPFDLESHDVDWVVNRIKSTLAGDSFQLDFFEWAERYLLSKNEPNRKGYISAVNAFARFIGKRSIDINAISRPMVVEFMQFIDTEPKMAMSKKGLVATDMEKSSSASAVYVSKLATIFDAAKDKYNDEDIDQVLIPRSPFSKVKKNKIQRVGQSNIGMERMQMIISCETADKRSRMALDVFIVSFCLMGANMADLYSAAPVTSDVWIYNRRKTMGRRADKAEMRVAVPKEVIPYINRLQDGYQGGWWLPALHQTAGTKDVCTTKINRALKRWCQANSIEPFTFYAARHTWASLARKAGVEKATIDECLCHKGDFAMADIYAERSWELMTEANRKVLDMFTW